MSLEHDLRELVAPALGADVVVDDVTVTPAGRRRVVRVTVDRALDGLGGTDPVPPLSLDEVADATRAVSDTLDASEALGSQPYTLEVSTPGVSRPLTTPEHLRRNLGRLVEVERTEGAPVTGRVLEVTPSTLRLQIPAERKTPASEVEIPVAQVSRGRVQVEFSRPDAGEDAAQPEHADESR